MGAKSDLMILYRRTDELKERCEGLEKMLKVMLKETGDDFDKVITEVEKVDRKVMALEKKEAEK